MSRSTDATASEGDEAERSEPNSSRAASSDISTSARESKAPNTLTRWMRSPVGVEPVSGGAEGVGSAGCSVRRCRPVAAGVLGADVERAVRVRVAEVEPAAFLAAAPAGVAFRADRLAAAGAGDFAPLDFRRPLGSEALVGGSVSVGGRRAWDGGTNGHRPAGFLVGGGEVDGAGVMAATSVKFDPPPLSPLEPCSDSGGQASEMVTGPLRLVKHFLRSAQQACRAQFRAAEHHE